MHRNTGVEVSRLLPFELFTGMELEELAPIAACCVEKTCEAGTVLIRQGQVGAEVYMLEAGSVKIFRERNHVTSQIATLEAPADFGEMAVVNPERIRTATVETATEVQLITISVLKFREFLKTLPILRSNLQASVRARSKSD